MTGVTLQRNRSIGEFIVSRTRMRELGLQQRRNALDSCQNALFKTALAKCRFHFTADRFPALGSDPGMNASIGNNLDIAVCQQ